ILRKCYQISDVCIVAGSFTNKIGGHNILEPCYYGRPVLFGPHMFTQLESVDMINQYKAGKQVPIEEVYGTLLKWLTHNTKASEVGKNGLQLASESRGSTSRTLNALKPVLDSICKIN